ncbi:hypothetical protein HU200_025151 [Digitaria exilis]|uniref:WAT1-related protein n=1 Tax=Digitaria exilis TaxID=1010633 RepID=A0A835ET12_9POAL|nr:hypothetical protein HU200_025151 [Digitaria exilis]
MSDPDVKELPAQATQPQARSANSGGWKPALCVVLSEVFSTGTILRSKVAIDWGTFVFSLLFYRSILGAVFTLPFALFFESGKWKDLDKGALGWLFLNAFAGYLMNYPCTSNMNLIFVLCGRFLGPSIALFSLFAVVFFIDFTCF